MNKSFSKRRHIQEVNQKLEMVFLMEQDMNTIKPNTKINVTKYSNGQPIEGSNGNAVVVRKLDDGTILARLFIGGFQYYVRLQNNNNIYTVSEVAKLVKKGMSSIQFFVSSRKPTQINTAYIVTDLTNGKDYGVVETGNGVYEFYQGQIPLTASQGSGSSAMPEQPAKSLIGSTPGKQSKYVRCNDSTGYGFGCFNAEADKIKAVQKCLGLKEDGYWGKQTQAAISKVRTTIKKRYTSDELKGICDDIARSKNTNQANTGQPVTTQPVTTQPEQDEFTNPVQ